MAHCLGDAASPKRRQLVAVWRTGREAWPQLGGALNVEGRSLRRFNVTISVLVGRGFVAQIRLRFRLLPQSRRGGEEVTLPNSLATSHHHTEASIKGIWRDVRQPIGDLGTLQALRASASDKGLHALLGRFRPLAVAPMLAAPPGRGSLNFWRLRSLGRIKKRGNLGRNALYNRDLGSFVSSAAAPKGHSGVGAAVPRASQEFVADSTSSFECQLLAALVQALPCVAADDPAADQPLVWARLVARQRAPLRFRDACVSVAHPRDHADVDHRFGRVTGPAQHLTVLQRRIFRQRGRDNVVIVEAPDLKRARTAASIREHPLAAPVSLCERGAQHRLAELPPHHHAVPAALSAAGPPRSAAISARSNWVSASR